VVKEQVQSWAQSLNSASQRTARVRGGYAKVMSDEFITEMALFAQATEVDIITTALIPGKTAPCDHAGNHRRYGCRAGRQLRRYQTW